MTDEANVPVEPLSTPEIEVTQPVETLAPEPEVVTPVVATPEMVIEPVVEPAEEVNEGFTKPVIDDVGLTKSPIENENDVGMESYPPTLVESPPTPAPTQQTSSFPSSAPPPLIPPGIRERRFAALAKRQAKKQARFERIVALARKRGKITNNDVQILLGVSDATASRYLRELATTGRLTRVGKQKRPFYVPV